MLLLPDCRFEGLIKNILYLSKHYVYTGKETEGSDERLIWGLESCSTCTPAYRVCHSWPACGDWGRLLIPVYTLTVLPRKGTDSTPFALSEGDSSFAVSVSRVPRDTQ